MGNMVNGSTLERYAFRLGRSTPSVPTADVIKVDVANDLPSWRNLPDPTMSAPATPSHGHLVASMAGPCFRDGSSTTSTA